MDTRGLSLRVKRPGRETDHSLPSRAEVNNGRAIPSLPDTSSRGQLYLYFITTAITAAATFTTTTTTTTLTTATTTMTIIQILLARYSYAE
jgi:hypothetical protein